MIGTIIVLIAFVVHGISKGISDFILFRNKPLPTWIQIWNSRDPRNEHAGNPLKCDAWHFFASHLAQWCICLGVIGGAFFEVSLWLIPLVWFGYFLEGRVFTLVFHCYLVQDWTFKFWLRDTFTF
jgi:hypothetical protein